MPNQNYRHTLIACYLGFVTQAITANFTPLLFLTFRSTYKVSLEQLALIPFTFYLAQIVVDILHRHADEVEPLDSGVQRPVAADDVDDRVHHVLCQMDVGRARIL